MTKITGEAVVLINKYTRFDPANPDKSDVNEFSLLGASVLNKDGTLSASWAKDGYIHVGSAHIQIELLPAKKITTQAVATLKKRKAAVLADAQAEATSIEQQIQSLLAITHEPSEVQP